MSIADMLQLQFGTLKNLLFQRLLVDRLKSVCAHLPEVTIFGSKLDPPGGLLPPSL